jgi:hypothetical protein
LATIARVLDADAPPLPSRADVPPPLAGAIRRCLQKSPADRFGSAAELLAALDAAAAGPSAPATHATWWRAHHAVVTALYVVAAILAWQNKEWRETPITVALFLALSAAATIGGVLRGHVVFTGLMNPARLATERRRTYGATRWLDLMTALLLLGDAFLIAGTSALRAVFALALALGIALAAFVLEPATNAAAFGEEP